MAPVSPNLGLSIIGYYIASIKRVRFDANWQGNVHVAFTLAAFRNEEKRKPWLAS
jgi:hypothetical protein